MRRRLAFAAAAAAALAAVALFLVHGDGAGGRPETVLASAVGGDAVLQGRLRVEGNVTVEPASILTLRDASVAWGAGSSLAVRGGATLVLDGVRGSGGHVEVQPGGRLVVEGSNLDSWTLRVEGSARFAGSALRLGAGAVVGEGADLEFEGSALVSSPDDLVRVHGGTLVLSNATLSGAAAHAVRAQDAAVQADGLTVRDAGGYALHLAGGDASLARAELVGTRDYVVLAEGAALEVRSSRLDGHCAILARDGTNLLVEDSHVVASQRGLNVQDGALAVRRSTLEGDWLVLAENASIDVAQSLLDAGGRGLWLEHSRASLEGASFAGAGAAIVASGSTMVGRNLTLAGTAPVLVELDNGTADLRWSWWGADSDPAGRGVLVGPARYDPWLAAAPIGPIHPQP